MNLIFWLLENLFDLTLQNFFDKEKKLWKTSLLVGNFLDQINVFCEKFPWLWKSYLTKENFLDCGKLTFLTAEKIVGLIILKRNASVETTKTYILSLEQKLSSLAFFCDR